MHTEKLLLLLKFIALIIIISSNILNNKLMILLLSLFTSNFLHNLMCKFIWLINTLLFFFFIIFLSIITYQSLHIYTFYDSITYIYSLWYYRICIFNFYRTRLRNILIWYKFLLILLEFLSCTLSCKFNLTIYAYLLDNLLRRCIKFIRI